MTAATDPVEISLSVIIQYLWRKDNACLGYQLRNLRRVQKQPFIVFHIKTFLDNT